MRSRNYPCSITRHRTVHPTRSHTFLFAFALALILTAAPPAQAQPDGFGLAGFDLRFGALVPLDDWDNGFLVGGSVNAAEMSEGVYLFPSASFSRVSRSEGQADVTLTDYAFGLETRHFPSGSPQGWFYGGGPSLHLLDLELGASGRSFGEASTQEVGATVVLGYALGGGESGLNVEGRGSWVSGFNSVQLLVGYRFGRWSPNPLE